MDAISEELAFVRRRNGIPQTPKFGSSRSSNASTATDAQVLPTSCSDKESGLSFTFSASRPMLESTLIGYRNRKHVMLSKINCRPAIMLYELYAKVNFCIVLFF